MGRAERENDQKRLEEDKKRASADIKFLTALKNISESEDWKNSGKPMLDTFEYNSFQELIEEKTIGKDNKERSVEPGEILIRQRVYNRCMRFVKMFKNVNERLNAALEHMAKLDEDDKLLNEE